ncbi:hypothetical protein [Flavobacterium hungaricum]|uniref:Uncharacterized protein n=1 Tax=Flavobacterium hungaricum TaxID=2082725 RepID=A0ABR9TIB3_9FLAO|nr:hypothetical protein [Flavobacterium hungaricum]MBE8724774.1 hypothetical protein [Flavobacterium hungaricum]
MIDTITHYGAIVVVIVCWIFAIGSPLKDTTNSPVWNLIIANVSFWFYLSTIYSAHEDRISQIITGATAFLLIWFAWIRFEEKEENGDREFIQQGKNSINSGVNHLKDGIRNKVNEKSGDGIFGAFLNGMMDVASDNIDTKVSGFLGRFNSSYYFHPKRGTIGFLRSTIIIGILVSMYFL